MIEVEGLTRTRLRVLYSKVADAALEDENRGVEGLTRTRLRELCYKMNNDRGSRVHENSTTCIV